MKKIRDVLRLKFEQKLSNRKIANSISVSPSTVGSCIDRAKAANISWPIDPTLDDETLEALIYPGSSPSKSILVVPDKEYLRQELCRKGVTLMLLWQEYKQKHPEDGYQYSHFCELYRQYKKSLDVSLRQDHRAGEKLFVDYSGDGIPITDADTGDVWEAQLFVATLGASNYTYAEVTPSQKLRFWIQVHIHTYEFLDGIPELTIPDNTKTGVTKPCFYEPDLNPTYHEMSKHYGTAILPTRRRKPKDKAKVENSVLIAQRWILAALRNHTFFSVGQANAAVREKLDEYNNRKFQKLDTTRRELFIKLDKPALKPLPKARYEFANWSKIQVHKDYHVEVHDHYYSVPYQLAGKYLEARSTSTTVEILYKGRRIDSYPRSYEKQKHTTRREHMPPNHQKYLDFTPEYVLEQARQVGTATTEIAQQLLKRKAHPIIGMRACMGILRLARGFGQTRVEAACARAIAIGSYSYKSVKSILETGLDQQPLVPREEPQQEEPTMHDNIRGPMYYN